MNIIPITDNFTPTQSITDVVLSDESADILKRLKKAAAGSVFKPDVTLVNKLKFVDPIELTKVLDCTFTEMVLNGCMIDPIEFLDRVASVIPVEKMQEAVKDDVADALQEALDRFEEAEYYLQMTGKTASQGAGARLSSVLDGIISLMESIITAFGIGDFFKPAESDIHADFKSQKIMMLLSLFSMISAMIIPLLGAAFASKLIGGILLSIAALSTIWPYIKPITSHLPANAENWTRQVQKGGIAAQGRKESLDDIAAILKMNRHAILVGPSRIGKSLTAKAFALAVERGDYPELKGKIVFRINTSDLVGQKASFLGGGNNILKKISEAMGRHRGRIILVLDEIHMACKNNEKIADQLKTFLDDGGEFPHVIGITTEEEYEEHVKNNNAFSLRFDKVEIKSTSQDETLKILGDTLLKSPLKPLINESTLDFIYEKSCEEEDAPQPASALKLLKRCMNRTAKSQKSTTEKKIIDVSNQILSLRSQAAARRGKKKDPNGQIALLKTQIRDMEKTVAEEHKELKDLFKSKDLFDRVTKEVYLSIIKISSIGQKTLSAQNEKPLKMFLLLQQFLSFALESHIEEKSQALGVKLVIDEDLINETILQDSVDPQMSIDLVVKNSVDDPLYADI